MQGETGWNDYGWRQYMPEIGRWNGMDQLSESYASYSPYAYVVNSPIMMFDPDGRITQNWLNGIYNMSPAGKTTYSNFSSNGNGRTFIKASSVAGAVGKISFGVGVVMDGIGVYNYYYDTDPNSKNKVHPAKAGLNTIMGAYGLTGAGTILALLYFGVDAFYDGGWEGYGNAYENLQRANSSIIPGFVTAPYGSQKF